MEHVSHAPAGLTDLIADATRVAVAALFAAHSDETFYYCALVTTGEGHAPSLTAWSWEALNAAVSASGGDAATRAELKWSYADSPYFGFGDEHFQKVKEAFSSLPAMDPWNDALWSEQYEARMSAMVTAMRRLDDEGVFGRGAARDAIVINVECVPPDASNTTRARLLNPPQALRDWLEEAAEP